MRPLEASQTGFRVVSQPPPPASVVPAGCRSSVFPILGSWRARDVWPIEYFVRKPGVRKLITRAHDDGDSNSRRESSEVLVYVRVTGVVRVRQPWHVIGHKEGTLPRAALWLPMCLTLATHIYTAVLHMYAGGFGAFQREICW